MNEFPGKQTKRLTRYDIQAPLQYRVKGERTWHRGLSTNISESGILFEGEVSLPPGTQLQVHVTLPERAGQTHGMSLTFQATVVRCPKDRISAARIFGGQLRKCVPTRKLEKIPPSSVTADLRARGIKDQRPLGALRA